MKDEKKNWYGLEIIEKIEFQNLTIIYGEEALVILVKNLEKLEDYLNFYNCLAYFKDKKLMIKNAFGIFLGERIELIRRKIKNDFLEKLDENNVIFLMEGTNREAYYEYKEEVENLIGIDLRVERKKPMTEEEANKELFEVMREISKKQKKFR